jgi:DNA-binding transcriptional MerR regulator
MAKAAGKRALNGTGGEAGQRRGDEARGAASAAKNVYSIGELSREFSITPRTIRFYESERLIAPTRNGSRRIYSRRDRVRLSIILRGKNLGFSLEEIGEYLALYDADPTGVAQMKHLLAKVEDAIEGLMRKRSDLDSTLEELQDIQAKARAMLAERPGTD